MAQPHAKTTLRRRAGDRRETSTGAARPAGVAGMRSHHAGAHGAHGAVTGRGAAGGLRATRAHTAATRAATQHAAAAHEAPPRAPHGCHGGTAAASVDGLDDAATGSGGARGGRRDSTKAPAARAVRGVALGVPARGGRVRTDRIRDGQPQVGRRGWWIRRAARGRPRQWWRQRAAARTRASARGVYRACFISARAGQEVPWSAVRSRKGTAERRGAHG